MSLNNTSATSTQASLSTAASSAPLTVGGLPANTAINDNAITRPFAGLTLSDTLTGDAVGATISFTAANGVLSGIGLGAGNVTNGAITYTLAAASPTTLQQELNTLTFIPTPHQAAAGQSIATDFSLTLNGGGIPLHTLPTQTFSTSSLFNPLDVAVDGNGDVYLVNQNYNNVQEFNASNVLLHTFFSASAPTAIAIDSAGDLFVSHSSDNTLEEFNPSGGVAAHTFSVNDPGLIATDNQGNVYVSDYNRSIFQYSYAEFNAQGAPRATSYSNFNSIAAIAVDSQGNVIIADGSSVSKYSPTGSFEQNLYSGSNSSAVAIDSVGNVYVGDNAYNTVRKLDPSGNSLLTLSNGVYQPDAIAVDSNGDIYVASRFSTVEEFSATGSLLRTLSTGLSTPVSLSLDSAGNLYVGDSGNNDVEEFAPYATAPTYTVDSATQITVTAVTTPAIVTSAQNISQGATAAISGLSIADPAAGNNTITVSLSDDFGLIHCLSTPLFP